MGKWLTRRAVAVCNSSTEKGGVGEWLFKLLETEEIILLCSGLEGGSTRRPSTKSGERRLGVFVFVG